MNGVNFIPRARRELAERRRRVRTWASGVAAYALLGAVVLAASGTGAVVEDPSVAQKLAQLPGEIDASRRALTNLKAQLTEAQAKLDAARAVAEQPDWSVLLGLLAQSLGEEIVLTSCKLDADPLAGDRPLNGPRPGATPGSGAGAKPPEPPPPPSLNGARYTVLLSGLGRTQSSVSQFVLRLEELGLFERVTILKTNREMFGEHESIGFRLEATIAGAREGTGAAAEGAGR
jgi:Tfp pilus assembly protein PilN